MNMAIILVAVYPHEFFKHNIPQTFNQLQSSNVRAEQFLLCCALELSITGQEKKF
jgi:hypothetical protein